MTVSLIAQGRYYLAVDFLMTAGRCFSRNSELPPDWAPRRFPPPPNLQLQVLCGRSPFTFPSSTLCPKTTCGGARALPSGEMLPGQSLSSGTIYSRGLPGELGFYDLRVPEVQEAQANLASTFGLEGFAYYYYWFGGRKILDRPLTQFLENDNIKLKFCLCWANENWTRKWDGGRRPSIDRSGVQGW